MILAQLSVLATLAACSRDAPRPAPPAKGPYAALVADAIPHVEEAVGLKFKRPPKVEARSHAEVRQFLQQQLSDSLAARDLAGKEIAYKLLGLLPDTLDLKREVEDLLTEQVVGFYDPQTKVLYVVDSAPPAQLPTVIAHELVHALQDQYINIDSLERIEGENDRTSAFEAIIEGQAVYGQLVVATGNRNFIAMIPGGWDRVREEIRENQATMPAFANAPMVLQETLLFPYLSGAEFMRRFEQHDPGKEPYGPLMPTSTKQILHPETAYFQHRDVPTHVTLPAPSGTGRVKYQNTLGEFETRLFLYQYLDDQPAAVRGAAGWEGDRYEIIQGPTGARTIAWVTVWDSPVDAAQFRAMVLEIVARRQKDVPSRVVTVTAPEIQGRPAVIYVDAPRGAPTHVVDPTKVGLALEP